MSERHVFPTRIVIPKTPGSTQHVPLPSVFLYAVRFDGVSEVAQAVEVLRSEDGWLVPSDSRSTPPSASKPPQSARLYLYASHRPDLAAQDELWSLDDAKGPPLLGPVAMPSGSTTSGGPSTLEIDIWKQNDWITVVGVRVDGASPTDVLMVDDRDDYAIGQLLPLRKGGLGFFPHGDHRLKERQERWLGREPLSLVRFDDADGGTPRWIGTLSAIAAPTVKLVLVHGTRGRLHAGSFRGITTTDATAPPTNLELPAHHTYNAALVEQLLSVPRRRQDPSTVDALPEPPERSLLSGDVCAHDQGRTNDCGPFAFAAAMNYWFPFTNNPVAKSGSWYAQPGHVDDTVNGARTPHDIVKAAKKFAVNTRDNDAERLDPVRALKLLKLWIHAGVPTLVLVEESYNVWSLHWKTVIGYDANRFFFVNSGADNELVVSERTPGVDYENAPIGNDVDSHEAHWKKWKSAGGDIVDLFTSVDACTFLPVIPDDPMFGGDRAR